MSRSIAAGWVAAIALGAVACGGGTESSGTEPADGGTGAGTSGCALPFLGDASLPVEMKVTVRGADLTSVEIGDGDPAPLILPPQGGRVVFVGTKATNLSPCSVKISGALRDATSGQIRVDARTTNLRETGDGWGASSDADMSTFSNIPMCPNQWATTDIYGHPFELTLGLTDRDGRAASKTFDVVPFCAEPAFEADCTCQCQKGYVLGQACP